MKRALSWCAWIVGALVVGLSLAHIRGRHGARGRQFHGADAEQFRYRGGHQVRLLVLRPGARRRHALRLPEHSESENVLKARGRRARRYLRHPRRRRLPEREATDEPYATGTEDCEDFEITLAENEYLVLGDNRLESYDSRAADVGVLSRSDFIGRARLKVWPIEQFFRPIY